MQAQRPQRRMVSQPTPRAGPGYVAPAISAGTDKLMQVLMMIRQMKMQEEQMALKRQAGEREGQMMGPELAALEALIEQRQAQTGLAQARGGREEALHAPALNLAEVTAQSARDIAPMVRDTTAADLKKKQLDISGQEAKLAGQLSPQDVIAIREDLVGMYMQAVQNQISPDHPIWAQIKQIEAMLPQDETPSAGGIDPAAIDAMLQSDASQPQGRLPWREQMKQRLSNLPWLPRNAATGSW